MIRYCSLSMLRILGRASHRHYRKINSVHERTLAQPCVSTGRRPDARRTTLAEADHRPGPPAAVTTRPDASVRSNRSACYAPKADRLYSPATVDAAYRSPPRIGESAAQPVYEQDRRQPSLWSARQSPSPHPGKTFVTPQIRWSAA
jgi:hypothetical protein